nr:PREDICTED: RNA-directed DNA polymerase from mobile element jockey-like isoform X2 [Bemisia tabaci]
MCNSNENVFMSFQNNDDCLFSEQNDTVIDYEDVVRLQSTNISSSLNFMAWNCGGLTRTKAEEFNVTLRDFSVDIALLSETWFTKNDFKRYFVGYKMYNALHPENKRRGGSSILIRENIKHNLIKIIETAAFQCAVISIDTEIGEFNLASIYTPPKSVLSTEDYSNFLSELGSTFLVAGDWNAKDPRWGSRITNPKGKSLLEAANLSECQFISPGYSVFGQKTEGSIPPLLEPTESSTGLVSAVVFL